MMKTPEDIKKGLVLHYTAGRCKECPYTADSEFKKTCFQLVASDALAYIQQLETRLVQVERERDAAVADLADSCKYCKFSRNTLDKAPCNECMQRKNGHLFAPAVRTKFEWRGVCEENTKEG